MIGRGLRDQKVIPESDKPIDDEDLYHISEIYIGRSRFWIYLINERVIGTFAILEVNPTTAKLKSMFVITGYHGQDIGQRLLEHALDFVRFQHYNEIVLTTHRLMKRAHRFYERNGFPRVAEDGELYTYRMSLEMTVVDTRNKADYD